MPEVLLVLGTSTGGVGRHVQSLAAGLLARGWRVTVAGPASTFAFPAYAEVEIGGRPSPVRDARAPSVGARAFRDTYHVHTAGGIGSDWQQCKVFSHQFAGVLAHTESNLVVSRLQSP